MRSQLALSIIGRAVYALLGGALAAMLFFTFAEADETTIPRRPLKAPTVVTKEVVQEKDGTGFVYVVLSDGTRCIAMVEGLACDFTRKAR